MPLYAYIKIPNIGGSESTDEAYDSDWIPLSKIELSNANQTEDKGFTATLKKVKDRRSKRWATRLHEWAERNKKKIRQDSQSEHLGVIDLEEGELLDFFREEVDEIASSTDIQKKTATKEPAPEEYTEEQIEQQAGLARRDSGGDLTITKPLDPTSTKLQLLCLQCAHYNSDQYIDGPVELHICRHIITDPKKNISSSELYMAYIMENCLITSFRFDASDYGKLYETITISFEKIHASIKPDPDAAMDTKGWDFTKEDPASSPRVPTKPSRKSK